jgi:hypothetical protein
MDVTSVTLDEVLIAAEKRAASLVPETAGYLALAVADASARLPFRLDDGLVTLTTEGTVHVARGSVVVPPEESARLLRKVLARLLERSVGSMPGLAAAARAREEQGEGATGFVRDLESALVPVNRAAARRALARLARETARARDLGKLKRRTRKAAPAPSGIGAPPGASTPTQASPPSPAPPSRAVAQPSPAQDLTRGTAPEVDLSIDVDVDVELEAAPVEPTPTVVGTSVFESDEPFYAEAELAEPTVIDTLMAERFAQPVEAPLESEATEAREPSPATKDTPGPTRRPQSTPRREEARVVLAPELASKRGRGFPSQREARIESPRSDVDSLLASFASASDVDEARSELALSVGLEARSGHGARRASERAPSRPLGSDLPAKASSEPVPADAEAPGVPTRPRTKSRSSWAGWLALLALGLVAAGVLGRFAPDWIEPSDRAAVEPG